MADVIAVVSKAVFEPEMRKHGLAPGAVWPTRAYVSQNKGLLPLASGGRLFLVTVRPPDEALWLVAVLDQPRSDGAQWSAQPNVMPIRDLSGIKKSLRFESGQGLPDKPGVLGMSLQTPRVLAATDIPFLLGDATAAAPPPPAAPRPAAPAKPKKATPKSEPEPAPEPPAPAPVAAPGPPPNADFESVVAAWRRTRHPGFAAVAEALSAREAERPPLGATGKKVDIEKWLEVERANDWRDVPRLMAVIAAGNSQIAGDRVTLLARRDDPRLVPTLLHLIEHPPYTAGSSRRFWSTAIATLTNSRDVRARQAMADLAKRYKPINDTVMGATIATWLAKAATQIAEPAPLGAADEAFLASLGESAIVPAMSAKAPGSTGAATLEELFAQIVEDPSDDAARLIYADMLSERGDPRGEFIVLQVERAAGRGTPERSDLEREKYWRSSRITEFGVPISTAAEKVEFARGFPIAVALARSGLQVVLDAPEWGTVQKVTQLAYAPAKAVADFFRVGAARNLNVVSSIAPHLFDKLKPPTFQWKDVSFIAENNLKPQHLERLPNLTHLRMTRAVLDASVFAAAPNLVEVDLDVPETASFPTAALFEDNPKLKSLVLRRRTPPNELAGLRVTNLEFRGEWADVEPWLEAIPTIETMTITSRDRPPWSAWPRLFEQRPRLSRVRFHFGRVPYEVERAGDGLSLAVLPGDRWSRFYEALVEEFAAIQVCGFRKLIVHPEGPRHRVLPLAENVASALRAAWGDAFEQPELL